MNTLLFRRFHLIWPTITDVRDVLKNVLSSYQVDSEDIDNAGLVITEYLTNLIRHATAEDEIVTLVFKQQEKTIYLQILDNSPYFPELENDAETIDLQDGVLREGGMGLALIKHFFPDYRYEKELNNNCFTLAFQQAVAKPKIVLVDDQVSTSQLLSGYLQQDYEVVVFNDEHLALDYLLVNNADVLLLDMHLQDSTAVDLMESLQNRRSNAQTSVVIMSADDDWQTKRLASSVGIDDYLTKPITKSHLLLALERILVRRKKLQLELSGQRLTNAAGVRASTSKTLNHALQLHVQGSINKAVSGDFYFVKEQGDRQFLILADVMGHGAKASIEAQKIKGFLYGFCQSPLANIEQLFSALSDAMFEEKLTDNSIVTAIGLEISERQIRWISAGHPLAAVVDEQKSIEICHGSQPLLGLAKHYDYQAQQLLLECGKSLLLYSDGLLENLNREAEIAELLPKLLPSSEFSGGEWAQQLWQNSLPLLSKDVDDSSLLIIN